MSSCASAVRYVSSRARLVYTSASLRVPGAPGVVVPLEQIEAATHALMAAGTGNGSAPAESPGTGGNGE
jgi:hypothetical protein